MSIGKNRKSPYFCKYFPSSPIYFLDLLLLTRLIMKTQAIISEHYIHGIIPRRPALSIFQIKRK